MVEKDPKTKKVVKNATKKLRKTTAKKTTQPKTTKKIKREPSPASLLKKVSTVSDSTKTLSKEIKVMTKIFSENQKVLVSMKNMMDSLILAIEQIQKQSRQINILEEDTQRIFSGLNEVRSQSNLISKINDQTARLQDKIRQIEDVQKQTPQVEEISQKVSASMDSIKNNSQMIIKMAQRMDEIKEDLRKASSRSEGVIQARSELEKLGKNLELISNRTKKMEMSQEEISKIKEQLRKISQKTDSLSSVGSEISSIQKQIESSGEAIAKFKEELAKISQKTDSLSSVGSEISSIQKQMELISNKSAKIEPLSGIIQGLEEQFKTISTKVGTLGNLTGKLQEIEVEINSLVKRADSTAFVGEGLKSVQSDFSDFKETVLNKTNTLDQKVTSLSDLLKRSEASASEFHQKTDRVFQDLQGIKSATSKATSETSKEMMALLKLSEYQSNMRMNSETKYGEIKDLENMALQTAQIINLFDRISIEAQKKIPLPHEVRQWAVSKMLDCADRWEVRFSDLFNVLTNNLGKDLLKESIRIPQVREIFGIRAVDEIRKELSIA